MHGCFWGLVACASFRPNVSHVFPMSLGPLIRGGSHSLINTFEEFFRRSLHHAFDFIWISATQKTLNIFTGHEHS